MLWDMDGVLVDTGDLHYAAWIEVLADYDIDFPREQFDASFGMNNMALLTMLLGRKPEPELYATINERKELRLRELSDGRIQPMPGVVNWLERNQKAGYRQAIASSAPLANIDAMVDAMGIRTYFDALVSGIDMPGKPEPDVFLTAAAQIAVHPDPLCRGRRCHPRCGGCKTSRNEVHCRHHHESRRSPDQCRHRRR